MERRNGKDEFVAEEVSVVDSGFICGWTHAENEVDFALIEEVDEVFGVGGVDGYFAVGEAFAELA